MIELSEEFYAQREASRNFDSRLATILDVLFGTDDDREDTAVGMSMLVGGAQVRGTVISHKLWEKEQIVNLEAAGQESHELMAGLLRAIFDSDAEQALDWKAQFPERTFNRRWIHFRDATVSTGGQDVEYPHFRVSLDAVQGWSIAS